VRLIEALNIWAFNQPREPQSSLETTIHAHATRTLAQPCVSEASADRWYHRLAHVSTRVMKTAEMVDGVKINEDQSDVETEGEFCQVCNRLNAPKQILRRPIGQTFGRYGRVHFDLVQFPPAYIRHQSTGYTCMRQDRSLGMLSGSSSLSSRTSGTYQSKRFMIMRPLQAPRSKAS
jgi:hypothetical protein